MINYFSTQNCLWLSLQYAIHEHLIINHFQCNKFFLLRIMLYTAKLPKSNLKEDMSMSEVFFTKFSDVVQVPLI